MRQAILQIIASVNGNDIRNNETQERNRSNGKHDRARNERHKDQADVDHALVVEPEVFREISPIPATVNLFAYRYAITRSGMLIYSSS